MHTCLPIDVKQFAAVIEQPSKNLLEILKEFWSLSRQTFQTMNVDTALSTFPAVTVVTTASRPPDLRICLMTLQIQKRLWQIATLVLIAVLCQQYFAQQSLKNEVQQLVEESAKLQAENPIPLPPRRFEDELNYEIARLTSADQNEAEHILAVGDSSELTPVEKSLAAIRLGDQMLKDGSPGIALQHYRSTQSTPDVIPKSALHYRLALCLEALGEISLALTEYRSVANASQSKHQSRAAMLGQARCWLRGGRHELAHALLSNAILDGWIDETSPMTGHALHLLALTTGQIAMADVPAKSPLEEEWLAELPFQYSVGEALSWLNPAVGIDNDPAAIDEPLEMLYRLGEHPEEIQFAFDIDSMSIAAVIELTCHQSGHRIGWTENARRAVRDRIRSVRCRSISMATLLDALLAANGLMWSLDEEGRILIRERVQASDTLRRQYSYQHAERCSVLATSQYPENALAPATQLLLGNMLAIQGKPDEAAQQFGQVTSESRTAPGTVAVTFNRGKVLLQTGSLEEALDSFSHVVDVAAGNQTEMLSHLYVGSLNIDLGRPQEAIRPLRRAVGMSTDGPIRATSILTLTSAYLATQNPYAANKILMEYRSDLQDPSVADQLAFLSALARYRASGLKDQQKRHGRDLLTAVTHVDPAAFFGDFGFMLLSEALGELDLHDEKAQLALRAVKQVRSELNRERLLLDLAEHYRLTRQLPEAQRILASLFASYSETTRTRALLSAADISFRQSDSSKAIELCRSAIESTENDEHRLEALRIMARVYEQDNDYERAAMCHAGILPELTARPVDGVRE